MSRNISLFSGYDQRENRTTNYCLLVLKMLYEENPKFFSEVLSALVNEALGDHIGVSFLQQQRRQRSTPDGLITQKPVTIYIETKNFDWFYDDQLERHLEALNEEAPGAKILMALGNFDNTENGRFERIQRLAEENYSDKIFFAAVSFADFYEAVQGPDVSKNLTDAISDFGAYLTEQNLLSTWRGWIDVINCATKPDDILTWHTYVCPAKGGAYNHGRCEYFGMYRWKRVECVALIRGVVDLESPQAEIIKWKNDITPDAELIALARERHQQVRAGQYPRRVFVLGDLYPTNFIKDTRGGMMGSKQYFDVSRFGATDTASLAEALQGITWSSLTK